MEQHIIHIFKKHGGILRSQELKEAGISYYALNKMLEKGIIEKIQRGLYRLEYLDIHKDLYFNVDEYKEVQKIVPKGVLCLYSAAFIHELTTYIPDRYYVAIPKKNKVRLPKYPPIKLHYWDNKGYELGVRNIRLNRRYTLVYDREKTVCDFIKFRNKVGHDLTKEVLKTYLRSKKDRNMSKLRHYSKELRVYSKLNTYLNILL